jgi:hypothetical protein
MIRVSAIRFFQTVLPPPVWVRAGFVAVAFIGAWTLILNPRDVDTAFGNILIVQMLATSSGFAAAASRGHFDPLLVSGRSRAAIALGHAIATSLPGLLAWALILVIAAWLGGVAFERAFSPQRFAAILIVSGCGWAVGLPLPRLVGGALWMALVMGIMMSGAGILAGVWLLEQDPSNIRAVLLMGLASVMCPFLLLGDQPGPSNLLSIALALGMACAIVASGVRYVVRRDYVLKEPA